MQSKFKASLKRVGSELQATSKRGFATILIEIHLKSMLGESKSEPGGLEEVSGVVLGGVWDVYGGRARRKSRQVRKVSVFRVPFGSHFGDFLLKKAVRNP